MPPPDRVFTHTAIDIAILTLLSSIGVEGKTWALPRVRVVAKARALPLVRVVAKARALPLVRVVRKARALPLVWCRPAMRRSGGKRVEAINHPAMATSGHGCLALAVISKISSALPPNADIETLG